MVTVRPVLSAQDRREFLRVVDSVYASTDRLRRPRDVRRLLELAAPGESVCYLAQRDGVTVGRVAAYWHPARTFGTFGLLECVDDVEVARALLSVAGDWLRARGCQEVLGPLDPGVVLGGGVMVDVNPAPNAEQVSHTAPWHAALIEACGGQKVAMFQSWRFGEALPKQVRLISNAVRQKPGLHVKPLTQVDHASAVVTALYNRAYAGTFGFIEASEDDLERSFGLKSRVSPETSLVAFVDGVPVAMALMLPNRTMVVRGAPDAPESLGATARRLLHERLVRPETGRLALFGVVPEYRGSALGGLSIHLYVRLVEAMHSHGMTHAEVTWTPAQDEITSAGLALVGAKPAHTYAVFRLGA